MSEKCHSGCPCAVLLCPENCKRVGIWTLSGLELDLHPLLAYPTMLMEPLVGTVNPTELVEAKTPEIEDTYQDVDSEEFSELSDLEDEADGEGGAGNAALDRLAAQSEPAALFLCRAPEKTGPVQAVFSEKDVDDMHTYLKESGEEMIFGCLVMELKF